MAGGPHQSSADVLQEMNSTGTTVNARYTMGPGIDQPLAETRGSTTSFYEADGLGSITSLSTSAGALVNTYTYDSFGKQTASSGTVVNPFRFTARELDSDNGLMYYRARYYDQSPGRFLSEDPLAFDQGPNFYGYVFNHPTDLVDPTGLAVCCPSNEEKDIEAGAENARNRLSHLRMFGTSVLQTDHISNVGGISRCSVATR